MSDECQSWGRIFSSHSEVVWPCWASEALFPLGRKGSRHNLVLPYGLGRSYGDSCLNDGGILIDTKNLRRFISFDPQRGRLRCEAGVSLSEVLEFALPRGFFLPVTPGTRFVTLGGAVANDIHGKNHHCCGTFGRHVKAFLLMRSDGCLYECSETRNPELFRATIGGLGLTGLIVWVEIELRRVSNPFISIECCKFESLDEFFEISASSDRSFEYTVAWVDCLASGENLGRGHFMRANHADLDELPRSRREAQTWKPFIHPPSLASVPVDFPGWALNRFSVGVFNYCYYHRQLRKKKKAVVSPWPFFYPLDAVGSWNRCYGKRGFFQFQCVLPTKDSRLPFRELVRAVASSGQASFLAVMKEFGEIESPGMLSFPRPGATLCLDLPNRGQETRKLLRKLELMVCEHQGAMYPAKDACMLGSSFRQFYPALGHFEAWVDPQFSSGFWRRMKEDQ